MGMINMRSTFATLALRISLEMLNLKRSIQALNFVSGKAKQLQKVVKLVFHVEVYV